MWGQIDFNYIVGNCLAVLQAAVIGKADELRGQIVKAFVVLARGYTPGDELAKEIQQSVRTRLSADEYPREVEFVDELPMTTTGKVRRAAPLNGAQPVGDDGSRALE